LESCRERPAQPAAITDTCLDGTILSVPAGKYTAVSQATADALALQDLNAQLQKCAKPLVTGEVDGRKFYIFKNADGTYKLAIK
jgi:molybdopterin/thiamine biosynthesis adenylyltransferase